MNAHPMILQRDPRQMRKRLRTRQEHSNANLPQPRDTLQYQMNVYEQRRALIKEAWHSTNLQQNCSANPGPRPVPHQTVYMLHEDYIRSHVNSRCFFSRYFFLAF